MRDRLRRMGLLGGLVLLLAVIVVGLLSGGGRAGDRAYELEQRLRCPVCKSVSIAESLSDTAAAMRATVEEQITAGRSDEQIIDYFTARYGEWVLMDPPLRGTTLALWLVPLAGVAVGATLLATRPRRADQEAAPLSAEDRARLAQALADLRAGADDEEDRL